MSELISEDIKDKIVKYLGTVERAKNRDIARGTHIEKGLVDKAVGELAKEGKLEYQNYGGITVVVLKRK